MSKKGLSGERQTFFHFNHAQILSGAGKHYLYPRFRSHAKSNTQKGSAFANSPRLSLV